jgi:amidase
MLDATAGPEPGDPYAAAGQGPWLRCLDRDPRPLRIAVSADSPTGSPVHPFVRAGIDSAAALLESLGHHVEPAAVSVDLDELYRHFWLISGANVAAIFTARAKALGRPPRPDEIEPATRAIIERARAASAEDFVRALQWAHGLGRRMGEFFRRFDVAVTPVYANPPLPVGSLSMQTADFQTYSAMMQAERPFTAIYNLSGGPAMSVPLHWSPGGLPIGIQFGADQGREDILLQLAGQLERAQPWASRRPPLSHGAASSPGAS